MNRSLLTTAVAHVLNARQTLSVRLQIRALTFCYRTINLLSKTRAAIMSRFGRPVMVTIKYADASPQRFWMSEEAFTRSFRPPELGTRDDRVLVVEWSVDRAY